MREIGVSESSGTESSSLSPSTFLSGKQPRELKILKPDEVEIEIFVLQRN